MSLKNGLSSINRAIDIAKGLEDQESDASFKLQLADLYTALADAKIAISDARSNEGLKWRFGKDSRPNSKGKRGRLAGIKEITSLVEPDYTRDDFKNGKLPKRPSRFHYCVVDEVGGGMCFYGYARTLEEGKEELQAWLTKHQDFVLEIHKSYNRRE